MRRDRQAAHGAQLSLQANFSAPKSNIDSDQRILQSRDISKKKINVEFMVLRIWNKFITNIIMYAS